MSRRRADSDRSIVQLDGIESGNHLHVNQVLVAQDIMLHRQQQLGPAGVEGRVLTEMRHHLNGFSDVGWLVHFETAENHHRTEPGADWIFLKRGTTSFPRRSMDRSHSSNRKRKSKTT